MELGITPIISSGMVFQVRSIKRERGAQGRYTDNKKLLAGTHLIDVNLDLKSDRELYQTAQKVCAWQTRSRPVASADLGSSLPLSSLSVKLAFTSLLVCTATPRISAPAFASS